MAPKDKNFPMAGKMGGLGGKYGRKAENLTARELKKAGGTKASAARKVDISQTRRDTTRGITLGPAGKPLTGRVVLSNGNVAVYKAGKRVVAAAAKKPASRATASGGAGNGAGNANGKGSGNGKGKDAAKPVSRSAVVAASRKAGASSGSSAGAGIGRGMTRFGASSQKNKNLGAGRVVAAGGNTKGARRPNESVQAYNDRIRDAPLANAAGKAASAVAGMFKGGSNKGIDGKFPKTQQEAATMLRDKAAKDKAAQPAARPPKEGDKRYFSVRRGTQEQTYRKGKWVTTKER
jgi:hypothetical protein